MPSPFVSIICFRAKGAKKQKIIIIIIIIIIITPDLRLTLYRRFLLGRDAMSFSKMSRIFSL